MKQLFIMKFAAWTTKLTKSSQKPLLQSENHTERKIFHRKIIISKFCQPIGLILLFTSYIGIPQNY
jgi:hypothetical protein